MNQVRAERFLQAFSKNCPPCMIFYGKSESGQKEVFERFFQGNEIKRFSKPKLDELIAIKPWLGLRPDSRYKVVLIEQADFVSKEASNFLLKVVEDSPPYVRWVLLTENLNVLGAIKSRSFLVPFRETVDEETFEYGDRLTEVLKSGKYCNAYSYVLSLKKACGDDDVKYKMALLGSCKAMVNFYREYSGKLHLIEKAIHLIEKGVRGETALKTLFLQVL